MAEPIVATLNIVKASILTIDTADLYLQLSQPADYILFSVTYNPNVFAFLPDSVQCALPLSKTDTSTPGVVSLKFESNALDATADVVRFSFRPLMAVTLSGFIVNNLSTNPKSTLKTPHGQCGRTAHRDIRFRGLTVKPRHPTHGYALSRATFRAAALASSAACAACAARR